MWNGSIQQSLTYSFHFVARTLSQWWQLDYRCKSAFSVCTWFYFVAFAPALCCCLVQSWFCWRTCECNIKHQTLNIEHWDFSVIQDNRVRWTLVYSWNSTDPWNSYLLVSLDSSFGRAVGHVLRTCGVDPYKKSVTQPFCQLSSWSNRMLVS